MNEGRKRGGREEKGKASMEMKPLLTKILNTPLLVGLCTNKRTI